MSNIIDSIQLSGVTYDIGGSGGVPESAFTAYTASTNSRISEDEEVTAAALNDLNESLSGKQETLVAGSGITISGNVISATGGGSITIDPSLDSGSTNAVANSAITNAFENINDRLSEDEEVTAAALNDLNERISGGSGNPTIELTQSQYDALVESGTVQSNTYYIITDAQAGDLTQYWTSAQTNSAITAAVSGKQDTLSAGTGIDITDNVISATGGGGGGKAVSGGTNISITTGETADTINCTLPIYMAGTTNLKCGSDYNTLKSDVNSMYNSIFGYSNTIDKYGTSYNYKCKNNTIFGQYNKLFVDSSIKELYSCSILGEYNTISSSTDSIFSSVALGSYNKGNNSHQTLFGYHNNATNMFEHTSGQYNVSSNASATFGDSGNTLFSVGNGTADNARHNAFEIRQNGDIYLTKNGQDVKLQDQLGGGGSITIDPSLDSGSTNAVANSAITKGFDDYTINTNSDNGEIRYYYWASPKNPYGSTKIIRNFSINGRCPLTQTNGSNSYIDKFSLVETSAITTSITSSSTDAQVPSAKAVYDQLGGLSLVKLTQIEYDALATKDASTLYIIVN